MKLKTLFFFLLFYSGTIFSQKAIIQSFGHNARWVSEQNFPNFISNKHLQDTVLLVTSEALKRKLNVKEVILPNEITYKYYNGFGKPKIKSPEKSPDAGDYNVAILSFITRDTYNTKVYWNMEIEIKQNGVTSYSSKTTHELECFVSSDLYPELCGIDWPQFIKTYSSLIEELLDNSKSVPQKISIGSQKSIDDLISVSIPNSVKLKMVTNGSFMSGNNFSISVEDGQKVLQNVVYHDGKDISKGKANFSGWLSANVITGILGKGSSSEYDKKTHEKRLGSLEFSNDEIHLLKMEWEQKNEIEVVNEDENGGAKRTGNVEQLSPMAIEIVKNDSLYGNLTYFREGELYVVEGKIHNHPVIVSYAPSTSLLRVIEKNETIVIVKMYNTNPESKNSFAGKKTNKASISANSKLPEWYDIYVEQNINQADIPKYMEAVFCLFFGIGNHI